MILNIKQLIRNKKFKNLLLTACEILLVAGIIFGGLMFVYSKINQESKHIGGVNTAENSANQNDEVGSDKYYIEVNIKKNAMIIYQYSKDKKTKKPYKVFKCSIGDDVKKGKYKTSDSYSWIDVNGGWHKYNTKFAEGSWIQSAEYKDKYDNTLKKSSYKSIGKKQASGSCIMLYAKDAKWIYDKCRNKTEINIVKGKKDDKLPLEFDQTVNPVENCGWDPTDPHKNNPYRQNSNGKIVLGLATIYVEKGKKPDYLSNLLAKDENGNNIADVLKYKKIDTSETGTYKVKYTYTTKTGKKLEATQKFKVIDTTSPVVSCSRDLFSYEVKSLDKADLNKKSNVKAIESMVRSNVSCNESGVTITVSCVSAEELIEGKVPVVIKAQDKAGNIGSYQVMCEISVKKGSSGKKYKPTKEQEKERKQKAKEISKDKKSKKNKKDKDSEKETTQKSSDANVDETTIATE